MQHKKPRRVRPYRVRGRKQRRTRKHDLTELFTEAELKILQEGNGRWWELKGGRMYLYSPEEVARRLGVELGESVDMPLSTLRSDNALRAWLERYQHTQKAVE